FRARAEEATAVTMVEGLVRVGPAVAARWELIIVDGGARDATGSVADALAREHAAVRVVHHATSRGYGGAIRAGLAAARYDYVFFTHGDCQFDPAQIPRLIAAPWRAEVVVGYRPARSRPPPRRPHAARRNPPLPP